MGQPGDSLAGYVFSKKRKQVSKGLAQVRQFMSKNNKFSPLL
jgi:hypothetical protein